MADIKTRDAVKGTIKTIDKAAIASERMKSAYVGIKEKAEQGYYADENSATEYAFRWGYGVDSKHRECSHSRQKCLLGSIPVCIEHIRQKIPWNPAFSSLRVQDGCIKFPQPWENLSFTARIFQRKRSRIFCTAKRRTVKIGGTKSKPERRSSTRQSGMQTAPRNRCILPPSLRG